MNRRYLIPFLLFVFINLVFGMYSGLGRMGWTNSFLQGYLHHGAIMVGGFLGTLIALEKVIPLHKRYLFVVPALSASSIFFLWSGNFHVGISLLIAASVGLIVVYGFYLYRRPEIYMWVMLGSAFCFFIGNVVLLSREFYPTALPWWMAFLLFTIVSERLELSKFLPVNRNQKVMLIGFLLLFIIGILNSFHGVGNYLAGLAFILISIWLLRHDVVKINLRKKGLTRFTGIALLAGYIALMLTGVFYIALRDTAFAYDALVHTFFIGFVFSMIFAHGPIILPGVIGFSVKPYHPFLYLPLTLLHVSLLLRLSADLGLINSSLQLVSGYLSATAFLTYFVVLVTVMLKSVRHAKAV